MMNKIENNIDEVLKKAMEEAYERARTTLPIPSTLEGKIVRCQAEDILKQQERRKKRKENKENKMITKEQSYQKIKDVLQIKLNYYEKIRNHFPVRSRTEIKELKEALKLLEELYGKQQ